MSTTKIMDKQRKTFKEWNDLFNPHDLKCYRKCAGKIPINKLLFKYDDIKDHPDQIAWFVQKPYIVVDVDDKETVNSLYELLIELDIGFGMNLSKRGAHFIFKNTKYDIKQGSHNICAIGFEVDIKCAEKGNANLPFNDPNREYYIIPSSDKDIDEIPSWLIHQKKIKDVPDFTKLTAGDGRNNALFNHYLKLGQYSKHLSSDDVKQAIRVINNNLFEEPLPENELNSTILRAENQEMVEKALKNSGSKTKAEALLEIATKMTEDNNIITSKNMSYIYNGKHYAGLTQKEMEPLIFHNYEQHLLSSDRREIVKFIQLQTGVDESELDNEPNIINVRNGRLNVIDKSLSSHTPMAYDTVHVNTKYVPDAKPTKRIDDIIDTLCGDDKNKRKVLLEMVGYTLLRDNRYQKAYMLWGVGRNGKSTFLEIMGKMLGEDQCSHLEIKDFNDAYMPRQLQGKLANFSDDIALSTITQTNVLKKLISGEPISVDVKYRDPITFSNTATMIFATNKIPRSKDRSFGFYRRFITIDFNRIIPKEKQDSELMFKINDSDLEYLLKLGVDHISEALDRGELTNYHKSEELKDKHMKNASSVAVFLQEDSWNADKLNGRGSSKIYAIYRQWCVQNGYKAFNLKNFRDEVESAILGVEHRRTTCVDSPERPKDNIYRFMKSN